ESLLIVHPYRPPPVWVQRAPTTSLGNPDRHHGQETLRLAGNVEHMSRTGALRDWRTSLSPPSGYITPRQARGPQWPLLRKADVAADMVFCLFLTRSSCSAERRVAVHTELFRGSLPRPGAQ